MNCKIEDVEEKKQIKCPSLYKSKSEKDILVLVYRIDQSLDGNKIVYYYYLNGTNEGCIGHDYNFLANYSYFLGTAHLSN
jgi:hypothetical protein